MFGFNNPLNPRTKSEIEKTLKEYFQSETPQPNSHELFLALNRAISGASTHKLIQLFNNEQNIEEQYDFAKKPANHEGIYASLDKLKTTLWIPESFITVKKK